MNENLQNSYPAYAGGTAVEQRNRVLRNTYWLLALSMVPTVLGAWIGVSTGIVAAMPIGLSMLVFFIGAFGLMFAVEKTKNSSTGVVMLLIFTFFMGLMLSRLLGAVLGGYRNGAELITMAFGGTGAIFLGMATMATFIKRDLSGLGKFLMVGAWIVFFASIAMVFLQSTVLTLTVLVMILGIFSAYILYDVKEVIDGGETNYVSATLKIYLDLYNVFQSLLSLLGILGGQRD